MVLLIDNYDSFTFNLVELLRVCGQSEVTVVKNDQIPIEQVANFKKVIFSPGPALPKDAPIMREVVRQYGAEKSILGVCLGHQAIWEAFGGKLYNLPNVSHGQRKKIRIFNNKTGIFSGLPESTQVGLYHSWAAGTQPVPQDLEVTATTEEGVIMAFRHKKLDITGVQFHPESYMTEHGRQMLKNWLHCV